MRPDRQVLWLVMAFLVVMAAAAVSTLTGTEAPELEEVPTWGYTTSSTQTPEPSSSRSATTAPTDARSEVQTFTSSSNGPSPQATTSATTSSTTPAGFRSPEHGSYLGYTIRLWGMWCRAYVYPIVTSYNPYTVVNYKHYHCYG